MFKSKKRYIDTPEYKEAIAKLATKAKSEREMDVTVTMIDDYTMIYYFKEFEPEAFERFLDWANENRKERGLDEAAITQILSSELPDGSSETSFTSEL